MLLALVWVALFSPVLKIDSVEVTGARHTDKDVVRAAADVAPTDNLLLVSTSEIEAKIEKLPWVDRAFVTRRLPGTIKVRIVERVPALVLSVGAATWTLDQTGRVLQAGTVNDEIAILGGVEVSGIEPGATLTDPEVAAALETWRFLPDKLRREVRAIFAPTVERISLTLADGTIVRYGAAEHLRAKNRVLIAVLHRLHAQGRTAAYIDVRVPSSPAIAPPVAAAVLLPVEAPDADEIGPVESDASDGTDGSGPTPTSSP